MATGGTRSIRSAPTASSIGRVASPMSQGEVTFSEQMRSQTATGAIMAALPVVPAISERRRQRISPAAAARLGRPIAQTDVDASWAGPRARLRVGPNHYV